MTNRGNALVMVIVAVVVGGALGYLIRGGGTQTAGEQTGTSTVQSLDLTKADKLRQDMRKLWSDHAVLTHSYIVAGTSNTPDKQPIANRLLKNQEDIGNALGSFYGAAAGNGVTELLKEHISIAVDIVEDARTNNQNKLKTDSERWNANGKEIAGALAELNPNWPRATLESLMQEHLDTTTAELNSRVSKDWQGEVAAWDSVYTHILTMSDALSDGIIKQFPEKF